MDKEWIDSPFWFAFGLLGQGAFFGRMLLQWVVSERAGKSRVPVLFWWFSLAGSMILGIYAIHRRDPVIVLGHLFVWVVYARILILIRRGGASPTVS